MAQTWQAMKGRSNRLLFAEKDLLDNVSIETEYEVLK